MINKIRRATECCDTGPPGRFEDQLRLGARRRSLLRWLAAGTSVALSAGAVLASLPAVPAGSALADRLAWGAAVCGAPLLLTYLRDLLATRRLSPQLGVAAGLLAVGALGLPLLLAVVVAGVLVVRAGGQVPEPSGRAAV